MKKLLSLLIASLLLLSTAVALPVFAEGEATEQAAAPDWIITEIGNDTQGLDGNTNGYTADVTADTFEFIEIYNNSGRELNLYDYALTYNGNARDNKKFEHQITEYTPIKGGDYLDGSNLIPTEPTLPFGDLSLRPVNPETCMVAPGEVVVLWMLYLEAYQARFNDGKGMSVADFRAHWNIPEDVKVIGVDANGNAKNGGHAKNFNVKNSDVGTYGIALQSEELNAACNVPDSPAVDGNYWESEHLVFWVTMDFTDVIMDGSMPNATYSFTWDFAGYATMDQSYTYINDESYVFDARRGYMLNMYDEPSVGRLNTLQKMTLGVELSEGESYTFSEDTVYIPFLDENILGFKVNGELYDDGDTFTAPSAGVYTFDFFFERDIVTEAPTEAPTEPDTEAPTEEPTEDPTETPTEPDTEARTEEPTEKPTETPTEVPTEEPTEVSTEVPADTLIEESSDAPAESTTAASVESSSEASVGTDAPEGGCGSVVGLALLPCMAMGLIVICKKRKNGFI